MTAMFDDGSGGCRRLWLGVETIDGRGRGWVCSPAWVMEEAIAGGRSHG